jgi:hypothetical protein
MASCDHGSETSGSVKGKGFFDKLRALPFVEKNPVPLS